MTITLPDDIRAELERESREAGFATVDEYVFIMYVRAKHSCGPNGEEYINDFSLGLGEDTDTPERVAKRRARLEELIEQGLNSGPPIPATPEFWAEMRRRADERLAAKSAKS